MEIKYKIHKNGHIDYPTCNLKKCKVGSEVCQVCYHNKKTDFKKKIVTCNNKYPEVTQ